MLGVLKSIHGPKYNAPQTEPIDDRQVENNAGGFVYQISDFDKFRRFLILGSASGSYYVSAKDMTIDNSKCISNLLDKGDVEAVVSHVVDVSVGGRAPKQSPGIFALAICCRHEKSSKIALQKIKEVCRTASTLFELLEYMKLLGGVSWGRATRRAILDWYTSKPPIDLAYQITKYQSRYNWSHRDLLRLLHPKPDDHPELAVVFKKIMNADVDLSEESGETEDYFKAIQTLKSTTDLGVAVGELVKYPHKLSWEHIGQTELLKNPSLWGAIIDNGLPMTAMIRNISRFAENGVLTDRKYSDVIVKRITDPDALKKSRIHPIHLLQAHKILSQKHPGHTKTLSALDDAFYLAFGNIKPAGKRILIGVDVSASMTWSGCQGMNCLKPMDAAAAMTLMLVKSEPSVKTMAFAHQLQNLSITNMDNLTSVAKSMSGLNFGSTDCSLPMQYALQNNLNVDCFIVMTDSETYHGVIHPSEALKQYRQKINKDAKLAVLAFSSNGFSIADPNDAGMIDIAGFDLSTPEVLRAFMLGYDF